MPELPVAASLAAPGTAEPSLAEPPSTTLRKPNKRKLLTLLALFLAAGAAFALGFYGQGLNSSVVDHELIDSTSQDLGEVLWQHFGSEQQLQSGEVKFKFWLDTNDNNKEDAWEIGGIGMTISVRRQGEQIPFVTIETDGEGTATLSGLDEGDFEVSYSYTYPDNYSYGNQHFFGAEWFEIIESSQGLKGVLTNDYVALPHQLQQGLTVSLGLRKYQPQQLLVVQRQSSVSLYDPKLPHQFMSAGFYKENQTLPKRFEVRTDKLFYVEGGSLYAYNPLLNSNYPSKIYDQVTAPEDTYYVISPAGKSLIYGNNDGAFFHTEAATCGRQAIRHQGKLIQIYNRSYPYDPIAAHFGDENRAVVYGTTGDGYRLYLVTCQGNNLEVVQLPFLIDWSFQGGLVAHGRLVVRGPFVYQQPCDGEPCVAGVSYAEGLYLYDLNKKDIQEALSAEAAHQFNITNLSTDGKYLWLTNHQNGAVKIFDFTQASQVKQYQLDVARNFTDFKPYRLVDSSLTYAGEGVYLLLDTYGECSQEKKCASIKRLVLREGSISDVTNVLDITDAWPERIVGELSK